VRNPDERRIDTTKMDFRKQAARLPPTTVVRRGGPKSRRRGRVVEMCAVVVVFALFCAAFASLRSSSSSSSLGSSSPQGKGTGVMLTRGHATAAGTKAFARRHASSLYREAPFVEESGGRLTLSSVGLGTYLGDVDEATDLLVSEALKRSVVAGMNHVDCASNYRKGRAELTVGTTLAELFAEGIVTRSEVFVATKAGFVSGEVKERALRYGATSSDFDETGRHCVAVACLKASLEVSRERLKLDCVDLLYLHNVAEKRTDLDEPQLMALLETAFRFLEQMRRKGQIRYYGLATFSRAFRAEPGSRGALRLGPVVHLAQTLEESARHGFRFVQLPVSVDTPEMFTERWELQQKSTLAEAASALDVALVSSKSLGLPKRRPPPKGRQAPPQRGDVCPDRSLLAEVSLNRGAQNLHLARSTPGLTTALVGHKTPSHVDANLAILDRPPLSESDFDRAIHHCSFLDKKGIKRKTTR